MNSQKILRYTTWGLLLLGGFLMLLGCGIAIATRSTPAIIVVGFALMLVSVIIGREINAVDTIKGDKK